RGDKLADSIRTRTVYWSSVKTTWSPTPNEKSAAEPAPEQPAKSPVQGPTALVIGANVVSPTATAFGRPMLFARPSPKPTLPVMNAAWDRGATSARSAP